MATWVDELLKNGPVVIGGTRPCWSISITGEPCSERVSNGIGAQRCANWHTTLGMSLEISDPSRHRGSKPPPMIAARWLFYDFRFEVARRAIVLVDQEGAERVVRQAAKVRPALRFGCQPLQERKLVLTHHANRELHAENIDLPDLWRVLLHGTEVSRQPYGVVRVEGTDTKNRYLAVCYRFNRKQEIVIITAFIVADISSRPIAATYGTMIAAKTY